MQMFFEGGGKRRRKIIHKRDSEKQILNIYLLLTLHTNYDVEIP